MSKVLGIEFAPFNIPVERRLQSLAVLLHFVVMVCGGPLGYLVIGYTVLFTRFYWLALAYMCYILGERGVASRGSYPSMWVRKWTWWKYYRDYFPVRLVKTAELDPAHNYLLCCFPHGVIPFGLFTNFATEANAVAEVFPGIQHFMITLNEVFNMPIVRELMLRLGMCSSAKESLNFLLDRRRGCGRAAVLVVGGVREALISQPGTYRLVLKDRKGFCRIALKNGASLVPVYAFGENEVYDQPANPESSWLYWVQTKFRRVFAIPPILVRGRGIFQYTYGLLPHRRPLTTVVGKPIPAVHIAEPTQEQVDDLHKRFVEALVALFEEHKHHYIDHSEKVSLVII